MSEHEQSPLEQKTAEEAYYKEKYNKVEEVISALERFTRNVGNHSANEYYNIPETLESVIRFTNNLREHIISELFATGNLDQVKVIMPTYLKKELYASLKDDLLKKDGKVTEIPREQLNIYYESLTFAETNIPGLYLETRTPRGDDPLEVNRRPIEYIVGRTG